MQRIIKKNLLEIIQTIYEAHESIKNFIDKKEYEAATALLSDCQETAIQLGSAIEDSEGEGFITIPFLEAYCETVYEVASGFPEQSIGAKAKKLLDKKLIKAENSIKNDIKARLEIVFMPYKASMWDSLESIWKAAKEDPDCDAYVVALPYYNKNSDGSFGEFHYEGNALPSYVNVIPYEAYDLEKRHPDIIYIHNPYDEYNNATSVDPRFYSYNLKKYTDYLVYVPYFVVSNLVPKHLCLRPACVFADKVIVQSEQAKNDFIKAIRDSGSNRYGVLEDKFIPLGNPKFDAVINAEKTEQYIPEEWKTIINGKKIVLYNTSLSSILSGNEKYLEKIASVLNYFQEHREVVLWWRPHPLSETVYSSMRNSLLDEYLRILQWYKTAKFGIFDDTPDLHRAIACSDAYYGDRSSLVAMYQLTGKPILLQNTELHTYTKDYTRLGFEDLYDDGEYLWFSAINLNGLFKMDKKTMEPVFIGHFPNENMLDKRLYAGITEHNKKLYFSPFSAREIAVYDMVEGKFEKISIDSRRSENADAKLYSAVVYKNNIIFMPFTYNAIVWLNTEDGTLTYYSDWLNAIKNDKNRDKNMYYFRNGKVIGSNLYIPFICTDKLLVFHLLTHTSEIKAMDNSSSSYHGMIHKGDALIFSPYKGDLMAYELTSQKPKKFDKTKTDLSVVEAAYVDCCDTDETIQLFPYNAEAILEINLADNTTKKIDPDHLMTNRDKVLLGYDGKYVFAKRIGNAIYAYHLAYGYLLKYDMETSEWTAYNIQMKNVCLGETEAIKINLFGQTDKNAAVPDSCNFLENILNLSDLCKYLALSEENPEHKRSVIKTRSEIRQKNLSNADGTAGTKIHQYIKQMAESI